VNRGENSFPQPPFQVINKYHDENVFARVYIKEQLIHLCEAYEVSFRRNETEVALASKAIGCIQSKRLCHLLQRWMIDSTRSLHHMLMTQLEV